MKEEGIFKDIKPGDEKELFGTIYGNPVKITLLGGTYFFQVEYENGQTVPYTIDGIPSWNMYGNDIQTIFYKKDLDLFDYDFSPINDDELTIKKIAKCKMKEKLEVKVDSGLWFFYRDVPEDLIEEYIIKGKFTRFREKK